jgi:ABC-2 type transport system permease protein
MAKNDELQMVRSLGWLEGFTNLAANENGRWWKTRRWLVQVLIWLVIVNGLMALIVASTPNMKPDDVLAGFLKLWGLVLPIGVVILGQDTIIQEKQSGTAAWILSKPASNSAFILSKIAANAFGILVTVVMVQGVIGYLQIWLSTGKAYSVLPFIGALGLVFLSLLFYLTLTIMLGTLFNSRGAVISIPLVLIFSVQILKFGSGLAQIMPWNLTTSLGPSNPSLGLVLVQGLPLPSLAPLFATVLWCLLFIGIALWKFNQEEL